MLRISIVFIAIYYRNAYVCYLTTVSMYGWVCVRFQNTNYSIYMLQFFKLIPHLFASLSSLFANVMCVPLTQKNRREAAIIFFSCHYDYYYDVDVSLTLSPLLVYIFDLTPTPPPAFQPMHLVLPTCYKTTYLPSSKK